jgi:hypothetical protein
MSEMNFVVKGGTELILRVLELLFGHSNHLRRDFCAHYCGPSLHQSFREIQSVSSGPHGYLQDVLALVCLSVSQESHIRLVRDQLDVLIVEAHN